MDKVIIELVNNNGKVEYNIQPSGNANLDNLGNIALQAIGSYIQYGNNPQGMMSQLMPMLRQMMGNAMPGPMNGMPNNMPMPR
jgi:hypothetical protein